MERKAQEKKDNAKDPAWILEQLLDDELYSYLLFNEAILSRLAEINLTLQAEEPVVPEFNGTMADVYLDLLKMFMKEDCVDNTPINDMNPMETNYYKPLEDVYVGQNTPAKVCEQNRLYKIQENVSRSADSPMQKKQKKSVTSQITSFISTKIMHQIVIFTAVIKLWMQQCWNSLI